MSDEQAKRDGMRAMDAGFRWAPGVQYRNEDEVGRVVSEAEAWSYDFTTPESSVSLHDAWPDFRDESGATLGVLTRQVREAICAPYLVVVFRCETWDHAGRFIVKPAHWAVLRSGMDGDIEGPTEVEALIVALEAAKGEG